LANSLERVSPDWSGWEILYRDRHDGRLWELTFPQSELQGGGPRKLSHVTAFDAQLKYNFADEVER
jgi:hypothetical protein